MAKGDIVIHLIYFNDKNTVDSCYMSTSGQMSVWHNMIMVQISVYGFGNLSG